MYARVLDNINVIIDKIDNDVWQENSANKDMLKFISDKLLSNSYKSGFDNIKNDIENAYIYENLQKEKLSFKLDACELKRRLEELNIFLKINSFRISKNHHPDKSHQSVLPMHPR